MKYVWENCDQCLDAAADMGNAIAEGRATEAEIIEILRRVHAEHTAND